MKKIILFLLLSMVVVLSAEAHKNKNRNTHITISIQNFYDELSPYGDWIYSHDYGYVWRPYFDNPEAFRPYSSGGHWVYTSYGWTWVSDYSWGWATFHYGRWDFDNYLGWLWIPGYEWAPAWVTWVSTTTTGAGLLWDQISTCKQTGMLLTPGGLSYHVPTSARTTGTGIFTTGLYMLPTSRT